MDFSLIEIEQARGQLEMKVRHARANADYLAPQLSRLIACHALGAATLGEIDETRQQIADCRQILEEVPAALLVLKSLTQQAQEREALSQRQDQVDQTLRDYFETRQLIIETPSLVGKQAEGKLRGLTSQLDRDVANGRLEKPPVPFDAEFRELIKSAAEYCHTTRSDAFSFTPLIPKSYAA